MAGGQQATSGQGSVTQSEALALVGLAINGGSGSIVADNGGGIAVSGVSSTSAAGTAAGARLVGLRSRKIGGGAASRSLSGLAVGAGQGIVLQAPSSALVGHSATHSAGSFTKTRTATVGGSALNASQGSVITGGTYLQQQAEALSAGYWIQLTGMGGLNYALITDPSGVANILDYCNKGGSDAPGGRLLFQGGAHTGAGGLTGAIVYNRNTNAWSQITPSYSSTLSHNWDSSCTDPTRGDFYAFSKTSSTVRRLPSGSTTWQTIGSLSISTPESLSLFWDTGRDALMAWNRNTGLMSWPYSTGSGTWSSRGDPGISGALGMFGCYCSATGELFLSDGATNPNRFWMYSTSNTFSSALTAPVPVFVAQGGADIVNHDTGSGRVLVSDKATGATRSFNPVTRTWRTFTPSNGLIPLNVNEANTDAFSIDIPDLGCTMFFSGNSNGAAPSCYLYRHTSAPIVPSTITFTGSHDMTQYVEDYSASTMALSIQGTLPSQITFNGTSLVASGAATASNIRLVVTYL